MEGMPLPLVFGQPNAFTCVVMSQVLVMLQVLVTAPETPPWNFTNEGQISERQVGDQ